MLLVLLRIFENDGSGEGGNELIIGGEGNMRRVLLFGVAEGFDFLSGPITGKLIPYL